MQRLREGMWSWCISDKFGFGCVLDVYTYKDVKRNVELVHFIRDECNSMYVRCGPLRPSRISTHCAACKKLIVL